MASEIHTAYTHSVSDWQPGGWGISRLRSRRDHIHVSAVVTNGHRRDLVPSSAPPLCIQLRIGCDVAPYHSQWGSGEPEKAGFTGKSASSSRGNSINDT